MGVGAGLYICDVVKKFTFAISSPDEFLSLSVTVWFVGDVSLVSIRITFSMIGKCGISGAFAVVCLYTPEVFPTTLRSFFVISIPLLLH